MLRNRFVKNKQNELPPEGQALLRYCDISEMLKSRNGQHKLNPTIDVFPWFSTYQSIFISPYTRGPTPNLFAVASGSIFYTTCDHAYIVMILSVPVSPTDKRADGEKNALVPSESPPLVKRHLIGTDSTVIALRLAELLIFDCCD
ncbi:hypothetical protein J6590_020386 [Homalodisca vitripennis]|nr:hypothetical protein J6590_020386 [Homalodisca vitripennis]